MFAILNFLLTATLSYAQNPASCPDYFEKHDGTTIQISWIPKSQTCFFAVNPENEWQTPAYRNHLFTSEGLFFVFNSYGTFPNGDMSFGAREYYFFPRKNTTITYAWNDETHELVVTHVTGDKFIFDSRTGGLKSITGAQVKVADTVNRENQGGIEISGYHGLLLDCGFVVQDAPSSNSARASALTNSSGGSCSMKNSALFNYASDGDVTFKYKSDKDFAKVLKQRCPKLGSF